MMLDPATISSVGFPIAVAGYLLFSFEKKLTKNTEALNKLVEVLSNDRRTSRKRK